MRFRYTISLTGAKRKLVFLWICLLASLSAVAQDGKEWLKRMNNAYATAKSVSMSFAIDYYDAPIQNKPSISTAGEVRYSGQNYYSDAMGQIVLVNSRYMLIVDKSQHTITCLPGAKKQKGDKASQAEPDSSWLKASQVKLLNNTGDFRKIEISNADDALYEKTEVTINATTYALEKIVYYYKKLESGAKPRLEISYSSVKLNSGLTDDDFSEKTFIQQKRGEISPAPAWNSYEIIDLTKTDLPDENH